MVVCAIRYLCYAAALLWSARQRPPTMWKIIFMKAVIPSTAGAGTYDNTRIGAAVCWEFMRTMTARRLRNQVDVIMGGSCWWSIPTNFPGLLQRLWEPANSHCALAAIQESARLIGAPVIHARIAARFRARCRGCRSNTGVSSR